MRFAGQRAVVVGLGTSGAAAARVLVDEGASVRVSEQRSADLLDTSSIADLDVELLPGGHEEGHLVDATLVVVSPGVPEDAQIVRWALDRGVPVWSELELGARICEVPYVGITGTNGKTTTTEMVASCMRAAGLDAAACGNVGYPFSLGARDGHEALAVEASSFQLRFHESFHPRVSVLLNVAEDHLDWHGSMEAYAAAKARIFLNQREGDVHVGNRDSASASISREAAATLRWFTLAEPDDEAAGYEEGLLVVRIDGTTHAFGEVSSAHAGFRADAAAAAMAAMSFGLDPAPVGEALTAFSPLPHRGETVATAAGVPFVDDSKATNPHAALAALEGRSRVVLIAGGRSKGVDLTPLATAAPGLGGVVAIGEAAEEIEDLFSGIVPVRRAESMEQAVAAAFDLASPGATVMLAPGCASQDMFEDYRERGDRFARAARELASGRDPEHS
ncbi:MAG: UDP-N-acetylmuramoyl-L-alanine--D-glutamate ligase [Actinomycetota bacterium]